MADEKTKIWILHKKKKEKEERLYIFLKRQGESENYLVNYL